MSNENKSSKPTPGPWSFEMVRHKPIQKEFGAYLLTDSLGHNIALISTWMDTPASAEEAHANAVLLSASHDLLESLEEVVELAIEGDRYSYADWGKDYVEDQRVTKAKAAIARARGLSQ